MRLCAAQGSKAEWDEFVRRFHPTVAAVVIRRARAWGEMRREVAAELIQETYLKLCADERRLLREFRPAHPDAFYGYLKVVASNIVNDRLKAAGASKRGSGIALAPLEAAEIAASPPSMHKLSEADRELLLGEIEVMLVEVSEGTTAQRDRLIFRLYYRAGLTAAEIAALPAIGMNTKSVESVIFRLTRLLRAQVGATASERGPDGISSGLPF